MLERSLLNLLSAAGILAGSALAQGTLHDVDLAPSGGTRLMAADKGLFRATTGGDPIPTAFESQSAAERVLRVSADPFDAKLWIAAQELPGNVARMVRYRSDNDTFTTVDIPNFGAPSDLAHSAITPGRVIVARRSASPVNQGMRVSEDGGLSWSFSYGTLGQSVAQVEYDRFTPNYAMAFLDSGLRLTSLNNGDSFYQPTSAADLPTGPVSLICSRHTNLLWYATTDDKRVWRTEDRGSSWIELPALGYDIHEHPQVPDMVWLANSDGRLQFSMDRGDHWSAAQSFPAFNASKLVRAMTYDFKTDRLLLVGEAEGHAQTTSSAVLLGSGTQGSGGIRPRPYLGGVVEPGNASFSFKGDRCLGGATVLQFTSLVPATTPLFGGVVFLGTPFQVILSGVALASPGQLGDPGAGAFEIPAPLPNNPAIAGTTFYTQFVSLDPAAPLGFGLALSPGLRVLGQP